MHLILLRGVLVDVPENFDWKVHQAVTDEREVIRYGGFIRLKVKVTDVTRFNSRVRRTSKVCIVGAEMAAGCKANA
jgi:hypothetical protein